MERVKTGISQLDEILHGGFLRGDSIMLGGPAGAGKTSLGLQFLVNGATKFGENGIFVTFEQLPDQLYRDAKSFGWDLRKLEEEGKILVVCTSPKLLVGAEAEPSILEDSIKQIRPKRIVIDSLSHLALIIEHPDLRRREVYRLIMYLKSKGLTSMFTSEGSVVLPSTGAGLSFLADCVIALRLVEIESSMRKALVLLKMRGSDHDKSLTHFEVTSNGIEILKPFAHYTGVFTGSPSGFLSDRENDSQGNSGPSQARALSTRN
jgi:circadian clock protein KaiC